jgi:hypothetical protein
MGEVPLYTDTLSAKKRPPPKDRRRAIGIGLVKGPRVGRFLLSEVPLYLADEKVPPPRSLQQAYAYDPAVSWGHTSS